MPGVAQQKLNEGALPARLEEGLPLYAGVERALASANEAALLAQPLMNPDFLTFLLGRLASICTSATMTRDAAKVKDF